MTEQQERGLKRWGQRLLGLRQGKAGASRLRAFAAHVKASAKQILNELNPNGAGGSGRAPAKLGVARLFALCAWAKDWRPIAYLVRCAPQLRVAYRRGRDRRAVRRASRGMGVAA